jgi:hypothetical protein
MASMELVKGVASATPAALKTLESKAFQMLTEFFSLNYKEKLLKKFDADYVPDIYMSFKVSNIDTREFNHSSFSEKIATYIEKCLFRPTYSTAVVVTDDSVTVFLELSDTHYTIFHHYSVDINPESNPELFIAPEDSSLKQQHYWFHATMP